MSEEKKFFFYLLHLFVTNVTVLVSPSLICIIHLPLLSLLLYFHANSLHCFLPALILVTFWFFASPPSLYLPPSLSPMPLLSSVAVAKTGRCAAITLIGCDFFIYMTSALQSWEPTACSLHPTAALVSLGPVVL